MSDYTLRSFPGWLRKGDRYITLCEIIEDRNEEIPLSGHLPETDLIEIEYWEDDFINVFNCSNEVGLFEYPISIYLFSVIRRDEVIKILEEINDSYSKLFLRDLSEYNKILKYKNEIYNYAELNYGIEFIESNNILKRLRETSEYEVKYNYVKEDSYIINDKNQTYDEIIGSNIIISINISRDNKLEKLIKSCPHIPINVELVNYEYVDLYQNINNEYYSNLNISSKCNFFKSLDVLKELLENKFSSYNSTNNMYPFETRDGHLFIYYKDGYTDSTYFFEINEFNINKLIDSLKSINYTNIISQIEIFTDENIISENLFNSFTTYKSYKKANLEREIIEIPFNIKY